jgi:hypothetical protein
VFAIPVTRFEIGFEIGLAIKCGVARVTMSVG